jgi:4-hydroxy-3-methylbut-2-enyl diphosphate reductase
LKIFDATCPLVSKVHREAKKYEEEDYEIILIGHKGNSILAESARQPAVVAENI